MVASSEPSRRVSIETPDWVKDAIFYQIFPDRFARSASVLKPRNLEPWDSPPTEQGYKGGDLLGVVGDGQMAVTLPPREGLVLGG